MIVTDYASEDSFPLVTLTVQVAADGSAPDVDTLYRSFREFLGPETARWIAFQTFDKEVVFYGNTISSYMGALSSNPEKLINWFADMRITSARATVLHFLLHPPLVLTTPYLDAERAAIEDINRHLASTNMLMGHGNAIERCGRERTTLVANCPPHRWFMGTSKQ